MAFCFVGRQLDLEVPKIFLEPQEAAAEDDAPVHAGPRAWHAADRPGHKGRFIQTRRLVPTHELGPALHELRCSMPMGRVTTSCRFIGLYLRPLMTLCNVLAIRTPLSAMSHTAYSWESLE